jgi:hypothetical protein
MQSKLKAAFWVAAAVSFAAYLPTLPSRITPGDSGDFLVCSHSLCCPHPPGYPLYTMTLFLASNLPLGHVKAAALVTAAMAAASTGLTAASIALFVDHPLLAAAVAIVPALGPLQWLYAITPEVPSPPPLAAPSRRRSSP